MNSKNLKLFSKKEIKKLWQPFIFLFLIIFLILNWSNISWVFNWRVAKTAISNFSREDRDILDKADIDDGILDKAGILEIPKIQISAPLIFAENTDLKNLEKELEKGVVHFPGSVLPGQTGQTILLGHSAPKNWPKIHYDWVFNNLFELGEGDEILVYWKDKEYTYWVIKTTFLEKGEEISRDGLTSNENMLVLITCWPPGKDKERIAVWSKLVASLQTN